METDFDVFQYIPEKGKVNYLSGNMGNTLLD